MKAKCEISNDTFTEYLEYLQKAIVEEQEEILHKMARTMVGETYDDESGFIAPRMSTDFNPNLFISGQEEHYWEFIDKGDFSQLEIIYTGMRLNQSLGLDAMVWSEFGDKYAHHLERDYAFYQETGNDPIAKPARAKHKYAIQRGVHASQYAVRDTAGEYIESLMKRHGKLI